MSLRIAAMLLCALAAPAAADGDPSSWADEATIEFHTVNDGEGHWSTVWVVVLEGEPYLRLGDRAAWRVTSNAEAPFLQVRIADEDFRVHAVPAPEKAEAVAAAMAEKYWSDLLIRFLPHPLTVRLIPEPEGDGRDAPG